MAFDNEYRFIYPYLNKDNELPRLVDSEFNVSADENLDTRVKVRISPDGETVHKSCIEETAYPAWVIFDFSFDNKTLHTDILICCSFEKPSIDIDSDEYISSHHGVGYAWTVIKPMFDYSIKTMNVFKIIFDKNFTA